MRYFIQFSYDGSNFHGSQSQPNGITIQQVMEQAFSTILRMPISLTFAGRTDAGVHALEMWAHFDCTICISCEDITSHMNSLLPQSIAIQKIVPVIESAHARFSAIARTYQYYITTHKDPFKQRYSSRVAPGIDFNCMNQAAELLLGKQDFASFCRVHTDVKTTFCTISEAYWNNYIFTITADRFLRNMVRAIVGTLLDVGYGKRTIDDFQDIIASRNRCAAAQSAPASGLFLTHITYNEDIFLPTT